MTPFKFRDEPDICKKGSRSLKKPWRFFVLIHYQSVPDGWTNGHPCSSNTSACIDCYRSMVFSTFSAWCVNLGPLYHTHISSVNLSHAISYRSHWSDVAGLSFLVNYRITGLA